MGRINLDDVLEKVDECLEEYNGFPPTAGSKMRRALRTKMDELSIIMLRYKIQRDE